MIEQGLEMAWLCYPSLHFADQMSFLRDAQSAGIKRAEKTDGHGQVESENVSCEMNVLKRGVEVLCTFP